MSKLADRMFNKFILLIDELKLWVKLKCVLFRCGSVHWKGFVISLVNCFISSLAHTKEDEFEMQLYFYS